MLTEGDYSHSSPGKFHCEHCQDSALIAPFASERPNFKHLSSSDFKFFFATQLHSNL